MARDANHGGDPAAGYASAAGSDARAPATAPSLLVVDDSAPGTTDPLLSVSVRAFLVDLAVLLVVLPCLAVVQVALGMLPGDGATLVTCVGLAGLWLVLLLARGAYEGRFLGIGSEEFKRVMTASATLLAAVATVAYVLPMEPRRVQVLPALAGGTVLLLAGRWLLRTWLGRQRTAGLFQQGTLVVGDRERAAVLVEALAADPVAGFRVVGTAEPPRSPASSAVEAWLDEVMAWIGDRGVHAVAVAESTSVSADLVRRLAWRLEGPRIDLLVSPVLSDVAGPRVASRPAAGLPLLHLDEPSLTGPKRAIKRGLDLALTVPTLLLLVPLMAVIALAIRIDSAGPVLYLSDRVGRAGRMFRCAKFRTMVDGAEALREDVLGPPDDGIADRYRHDPRVTRVGRLLRRWSLDELPQLGNVISGSMSLVGPRPMLPSELGLLGDAEHRRHLTKPGLTGLWQVSGRKEVSWDDRMRMDLNYIENWSIALDLVILAKTAKAVLTGQGAY